MNAHVGLNTSKHKEIVWHDIILMAYTSTPRLLYGFGFIPEIA